MNIDNIATNEEEEDYKPEIVKEFELRTGRTVQNTTFTAQPIAIGSILNLPSLT